MQRREFLKTSALAGSAWFFFRKQALAATADAHIEVLVNEPIATIQPGFAGGCVGTPAGDRVAELVGSAAWGGVPTASAGGGPRTCAATGAGGSSLPSDGSAISPAAWLRKAACAARFTSVWWEKVWT